MAHTRSLKAVDVETTVTISVKDLNEPAFCVALEKVDGAAGVLKGRKAWSFADFKAQCDERRKKASQQYQKLLVEHVETEAVLQPDDDGNMVPALDANGTEIKRFKMLREDGKIKDYIYKDQPGFIQAYEELMGISFESRLMLLTTEEVAQIGLTPKEMRSIRKLVADATPIPKEPEAVSS